MMNPVNSLNNLSAVYLQSAATARQPSPSASPPPIDQPQDTYTPSRASDLDHDGDSH